MKEIYKFCQGLGTYAITKTELTESKQ